MKVANISHQQAYYLAEVASGKGYKEIADSEFVSFQTVRYQLEGLKTALNAETLPNLVALGLSNNIIVEDGQGSYKPSAERKQDPRPGRPT